MLFYADSQRSITMCQGSPQKPAPIIDLRYTGLCVVPPYTHLQWKYHTSQNNSMLPFLIVDNIFSS